MSVATWFVIALGAGAAGIICHRGVADRSVADLVLSAIVFADTVALSIETEIVMSRRKKQ